MRLLTLKLRGHPETPVKRRGCVLSSRARGDTADVHGPLQPSLEGALVTTVATSMATPIMSTMISKMSMTRIVVTT
jgi:hypothetical protein